MQKIIFKLLAGSLLTLSGTAITIIYSLGLLPTSFFWLMLLAFPVIALGIFFLSKVGASMYTMASGQIISPEETTQQAKSENVLNKNNSILNQWKKTVDMKDRLKVVEVAAEEEETPQS